MITKKKNKRHLMLLLIIFLNLFGIEAQITNSLSQGTNLKEVCNIYQIELNGECVDCNSLMHGCSQCQIINRDYFGLSGAPALQCLACDYGMYLLQFESNQVKRLSESDKYKDSKDVPAVLNMCLHKCEDFAHNYVSNPSTKKCEYCGPNCMECNLQYGCTRCQAGSTPKAEGYLSLVNGDKAQWPYSFNKYTKYKGPSSNFQVCVACNTIDGRCNDCSEGTSVNTTTKIEDINTKWLTKEQLTRWNEYLEFTTFPAKKNVTRPDSARTCQSCHEWVQSKEQQEQNGRELGIEPFCKLNSEKVPLNNASSCIQPNLSNTNRCDACKPGFYINSTQQCQQCNSTLSEANGCRRCNSSQCLECLPGYTLFNGTCQQCNVAAENERFYSLITHRCSQCEASDLQKCSYCDMGWMNSLHTIHTFYKPALAEEALKPTYSGNSCNFHCGPQSHRYPDVEYKVLNGNSLTIAEGGKTCKECHSSCLACSGPTEYDCTQCPQLPVRSFLAITDPISMKGKCEQKEDIINMLKYQEPNDLVDIQYVIGKPRILLMEKLVTQFNNKNLSIEFFNIYVKSIDESKEVARQRKGTYNDPFATLTDALVRAREVVAPYINPVNVTIHLFAGDHFVVENRLDAMNIYSPKEATDEFLMNMNLTIKPLSCNHITAYGTSPKPEECGTRATIYNKVRERLQIHVNFEAHVINVTIDSADSVLPAGTPCLSEYRQCCKLDEQVGGLVDFSSNVGCKGNFTALKLSDQCKVGHPRSLFNQQQNNFFTDYITDPYHTILELKNVEIKNIYYGMNSMINMTELGGQINITNSKFSHINICGSIIKNNHTHLQSANLSMINESILPNNTKSLMSIIESHSRDLKNFSRGYTELYLFQKTDDAQKDNFIDIRGSTFTNLNYRSKIITEPNMVASDLEMMDQALVANFDNFNGIITIINNTFTDNIYEFDSCNVLPENQNDWELPLNFSSPILAPLNETNNFKILNRANNSIFDRVQLMSLINVRNHQFKFLMADNIFHHNNGLKGIVNLEFTYLIAPEKHGILIHNNLFEQNSALIESNVLNIRKRNYDVKNTYDPEEMCGGIQLSDNVFRRNVGCKNTHGAVRLSCFDNALPLNPAREKALNNTIDYKPVIDSQFQAKDMFNINILDSYDDPQTFYGFNQPTSFTNYVLKNDSSGLKTATVSNYKLMLINNTYEQNYAGNKRAIVSVEGYPVFYSINETYRNNENWIPEALQKYSIMGKYVQNSTMLYRQTDLANYQNKARTMLMVKRAVFFSLNGTVFDNNYVIDDVNLTRVDPIFHHQSHSFLLTDFAGNFIASNGATFKNNIGVAGGPLMKTLLKNYTEIGFKSKLFHFSRYSFNLYELNNTKFQGNHAIFNGLQHPKLFNFSRENFYLPFEDDKPETKLHLVNVEISSNIFKNTDCMVELPQLNYTYHGFNISHNGRRLELKDIGDDKNTALVKFNMTAVDTIKISNFTVENNHMRKGAALVLNPIESQLNTPKPYVQVVVTNGTHFGNNTSFGPTSSLKVEGVTPWLWVRFNHSSFLNNWGYTTNDFWAFELKRLEIINSVWKQKAMEFRSIEPDTPPLSRAKVLYVNDTQYQIHIEGNTFDCQQPLDRNFIFTYNHNIEDGDDSLFSFLRPTTNRTYLTNDTDPQQFDQDGYEYPLTSYDSSIRCRYHNGQEASFNCTNKMFYWQFHNNTYRNCNQAYQGGIFHLENQAVVNISSGKTLAQDNSALKGGFAYLKGKNTQIQIHDRNLTLQGQRAYFGGAFYIEDNAHLQIENVIIRDCELYDGLIYLDNNATMAMSYVSIFYNLAHHRAMISSHDYSFFFVEQSKFSENRAYHDSVLIYMDTAEDHKWILQDSLTEFEVYPYESKSSEVLESEFTNNTMDSGGSLVTVVNSNFNIENTKIIGNRLFNKHGGIHLVYSHLEIFNNTFDMAQPGQFQYGLINDEIDDSLQGGFLYIGTNSSVNSRSNVYNNSRAYVGGCVAIQGFSRGNFFEDTFNSCGANVGGAIYAVDFDVLNVTSCSFQKNMAFEGIGSNIYAVRFHGVMRLTNSTFRSYTNSIYLEQGYDLITDSLYLDAEPNMIQNPLPQGIYNNTLNKTDISGYDPPDNKKNQSQAQEKKNLIDSLMFYDIIPPSELNNYQQYGGGFHLLNMKSISSFKKVTLVNLRAENGGCIYIELDQNMREQETVYNKNFYNFERVNMTKCLSIEHGGAMFIKNIRQMRISNDSLINEGYAFGDGGGINFICDRVDLGECKLELRNTKVINNQAKMNGGGIHWPDIEPVLVNTNVSNNLAGMYGNNFASYPIKLVRLITQYDHLGNILDGLGNFDIYSDYLNMNGLRAFTPIDSNSVEFPNITSTGQVKSIYKIPSVQSGGFIAQQYMALLDKYNQVCANNKGSRISISISDNSTVIIGSQKFFSANGVYNISGMEIYTKPGDNNTYMFAVAEPRAINLPRQLYNQSFYLDIQECQIGEAQLKKGENFICQKCVANTYSLVKPLKMQDLRCLVCPADMAVCEGGSRIGPKPGYWRRSNETDKFMPCKVRDACLGHLIVNMTDPAKNMIYNANGFCNNGYYGALCSACKPGWHKQDKHGCQKCESPEWNAIRMFIIISTMILCVCALVRSTINSQTKRQTHAVFIKIMMNHLQMILITTSFNMKWPDEIIDFFKTISIVVEAQKMLVAFDCWMDTRVWTPEEEVFMDTVFIDREEDPLRITYKKLFIYAALPVICGVLACFVWWCILRRQYPQKKQLYEQLYIKFISTLVILLFLVHPQITQFMIDMFNCQPYDKQNRLEVDLQILCWEHKHKFYAYVIALPCFLIWGLGIPAMIYVLMAKEKENLDTDAAKIKYGFLYNGYKRSNYTWEIVIMYRKTICLSLAVFLSGIGIIVQALVLLILLVVFLSLNSAMRPFAERTLNEIEDISLIVQIITIYCGLFFISGVDKSLSTYNPNTDFSMTEESQYIFFFTIMVVNIIFFFMWTFKFIMTLKTMFKQNYENIYVIIFLCCRKDKLIKDEEKLAREAKRETIIEKIEDIQFFIKKMKDIYSKEIFYEGHDKFIKLLYYIENQRRDIDLTVKRHNLYIQGKMARDRKFDPERMKELKEVESLSIDDDFGAQFEDQQADKKMIQQMKSHSHSHRSTKPQLKSQENKVISPKDQLIMINDEQVAFKRTQLVNKVTDNVSDMNTRDSKSGAHPEDSSADAIHIRQDMLNNSYIQNNSMSKLNLGEMNAQAAKQEGKGLMKNLKKGKKPDNGLDSDNDSEDEDGNKVNKKKYKRPNVADANDAIQKSRNYKAQINYEQKSRIFAQDLDTVNGAHKYMLEYFKDWKPEESESDEPSEEEYDDQEDSPQKSEMGGHDLDIRKIESMGSKESKVLQVPNIMNLNLDLKMDELLPNSPMLRSSIMTGEQSHPSGQGSPFGAKKLGRSKTKGGLNSSGSKGLKEPGSGAKKKTRKSQTMGTFSEEIAKGDGSATKRSFSPNKDSIASIVVGVPSLAEGLPTNVEVQEKLERTRLRPNVLVEYRMVVDENNNLKKVETRKPELKDKRKEERVDPETQQKYIVSISNESDLLKCSILDSEGDLHINYKEPKNQDMPFHGSFSENSDESPGLRKTKNKKSVIQVEKVQIKEPIIEKLGETSELSQGLNASQSVSVTFSKEQSSSQLQSSTLANMIAAKSKETNVERSETTDKVVYTAHAYSRNQEQIRASHIDIILPTGKDTSKLNQSMQQNADIIFIGTEDSIDKPLIESEHGRQKLLRLQERKKASDIEIPKPPRDARSKNPFRKLASQTRNDDDLK